MSISYLMRTTHGRFHVNRPMWFASFRYCIGFRLTTMTFSIFDRAHVCIHEHKSKKNPSWLLHAPKICDSEYPSQELNLRLTFYKNVALTTELEGWNTGGEGTKKSTSREYKGRTIWFVPQEGVEPSRRKTTHFECVASTDFAIGAVARLRDVRFRSYRTTHWLSYHPPSCKSTKVRDWRKLIFLFTKFFLQVWRVCFAGVA